MQYRPIKYIDGFSESAWKSLAVKSLRIGWLTGLEMAASKLSPSAIQSLLLCGIFEDTFPAADDLQDVLSEVRRRDFAALCARETHHGRGYTARFCELEPLAVDAAQNRKSEIWADARPLKVWLPPRSLNCFWTWRAIHPTDTGVIRQVDRTAWAGMPAVMLDAHTAEGKTLRTRVTLLSGHYFNHLKLSELVAAAGWEPIRQQTQAEVRQPVPLAQASLF